MLLIMMLNKNKEPKKMQLNDKEIINFYQLFPVYEEELMYIRKNGYVFIWIEYLSRLNYKY